MTELNDLIITCENIGEHFPVIPREYLDLTAAGDIPVNVICGRCLQNQIDKEIARVMS